MSLLTTLQNACDRLGIVRPTVVIGSADLQVRQLLALAQQEGKELSRRYPWQVLSLEKTFTATATETQTGALPAGFDYMYNETFYNRTAHRRVTGPLDTVEWQSYKATTTTLVFDAFRIRNDALLLAPTPNAGDSYAYEYKTKYWVATASASTTPAQESWLDDTDVGILSEEMMTDGVVWRFKKAKGLDYGEEFRTYEANVMLAATRDGGKRNVDMGRSFDYRRVRAPQFPDGSWSLS